MKAILFASLMAVGLASTAMAANARHPFQNCDRKVDNCGPTGDNMTDQLNQQQLQGAGTQGLGGGQSTQPGAPMQNGSIPRQ